MGGGSRTNRFNSSAAGEVPGLTGLRFVAAFSVLLAHSMSVLMHKYETPQGVVYWCMQASGFGMTLFFVLSGFVIHYNYASAVTSGGVRGIAGYLWARFARLYPLFLLILFVGMLQYIRPFHMMAGQFEQFDTAVHTAPYFLLSIQSWVYFPVGDRALFCAIGGIACPTWSISTEWFFYFVFPFIAWIVLQARTPWQTAILGLVWIAVWIALATNLYDRSPQLDAWAVTRFGSVAGMSDYPEDSFVRWLLYISPYLRIGEFILGTCLAQLYVQMRNVKVRAWENLLGTAVFLAAAASVFLITYWEYSPDVGQNIFREMNMNFALAPSAALLIFCAARYRNVASRLLNARAVVVFGDASYSIYLLHFGVLATVAWLVPPHGIILDTLLLVIVMVAILLASVLLYRYYEAPARKWLRQGWSAIPTKHGLFYRG